MAAGKEFPVSLIIRAVDKVTAPLRAISAKLQAAGLGAVTKGFSGLGGALKNVGSEAFALGAKLLALGGTAAFALFSIVKGSVEAGDKLAEMSQRVGLGVDAYASLQHAANLADVDQEAFNSAMDQFNKRLGEAKANGGPLLSFLNKVSPKLAEQVKGAKSTEAALSLMTDAFARIQDPGKRAALAAEAFGKSGLQMGEFLRQGSAAIQKQQLEYLRLAGSQEAFALGASDLDNALKEVETAFGGLRSAAMGALFPAFTLLAKAVTEFIAKNRDGLKKWAEGAAAAITKWVQGGGIERLVDGIKRIVDAVLEFVDMIGGFKVVALGIAAVMAGPLLSAIVAVIPVVYSLGVALLTTPVGWFLLAVAAIAGAAYLIYKNWDGIKEFFGVIWDGVKQAFGGLAEIAEGLVHFDIDKIIHGWTEALGGLRQALAPILALISLLPGGSLAIKAANFASGGVLDKMFNGAISGPALGAEQARPQAAELQSTEARVSVDFSNMPPGTRVTQDKNSSQPVDMSLGYSMASY